MWPEWTLKLLSLLWRRRPTELEMSADQRAMFDTVIKGFEKLCESLSREVGDLRDQVLAQAETMRSMQGTIERLQTETDECERARRKDAGTIRELKIQVRELKLRVEGLQRHQDNE